MTVQATFVGTALGLLLCCLLCNCSPTSDSASNEAGLADRTGRNDGASKSDTTVVHGPDGALPSGKNPVHSNRGAHKAVYQSSRDNAWDILEDLAWLSTDNTQDHGEQITSQLDRLSRLGDEALIAIGDFLLSADSRREEQLELRRSLLHVLLSLGLPEVEDLALQLLAGGPTPIEIWQLGRYLEQVQPGRYSDSIRRVAEQTLVSADVTDEIPGELFQLLGELGDEGTVKLLAQMPMHRGAYASVALALIPDGSGFPLLQQDALFSESGQQTTRSRLAMELLACQAPRNFEAGEALVDLAERGLIPSDIWPHVIAMVSGRRTLILEQPTSGRLETHTIYRPDGNQVIYRVSVPVIEASPDVESQRLFLLDRLQSLAPELSGELQ